MWSEEACIAAALVPAWRWAQIASAWRRGEPADQVLAQQWAEGQARGRGVAWARGETLAQRAAEVTAAAVRAGLVQVTWASPDYPVRLLDLPDPPPALWVRGDPGWWHGTAVALVGSRACTNYARTVAGQLAEALSARGLVVVSGLARGVDAAAHAGALAGGGGTVAILGSGADIVYPPEHEGLAAAVAGRGALVSEFVPGTSPRPAWFPRRNRLIAALCRAVVVVEAGERSGSLITARCAAEQGRDVLAVPGSILGPHNRGGHALLRDGARVVMHVDDILDELGMAGGRPALDPVTGAPSGATDTDPVLAALHVSEARDLDDVVARSGVPATTALARLLELELAGAVVRSPGGRFARTVPAVLG